MLNSDTLHTPQKLMCQGVAWVEKDRLGSSGDIWPKAKIVTCSPHSSAFKGTYFTHVFDQVSIEVTRGPISIQIKPDQRSNLAVCVISPEIKIISETL